MAPKAKAKAGAASAPAVGRRLRRTPTEEVANKAVRDNFSDMPPEDVWIRTQGEPPSTLFFEICADLLSKRMNPQFTMGATYYKGKAGKVGDDE